jgi:hypothetical protein
MNFNTTAPGTLMKTQPTFHRKISLIGKLTILFYLFLPLEGVLRKWVFGDFEQIFGFIRDPILLGIFMAYALRTRGRLTPWVGLFFIFGSMFVAFVLLHGIAYGSSPLVMLLGLRSYILYIPLTFILAELLTTADLEKLVKVSLYISIPIALLVVVQFFSPVESALNKGTSDAITGRFTVIENVVRPYGPFTFVQAQNHFAALMCAIVLIAWEKRREYTISLNLLVISSFSTFTMGALSGGRTFFGLALLVCSAYVLAGLTARKSNVGLSRLTAIGVLMISFFIIFIFVFPSSFAAMLERQEVAQSQEGSTLSRALSAFDISEQMGSAPAFGYGAGSGSNAAIAIGGQQDFFLGETEWGRTINELGPYVGSLWILFRVAFTVWLFRRCIVANRLSGDGSALVAFGFSGYMLLYAQTTGQNQNLSFCWLTLGVTLALCRLALASFSRPNAFRQKPQRNAAT